MPFDVKALLHNKPALAGLGVAAAAGLYVLVRRKQITGSTTSGAGLAGGQTPYTVPSSYPDTTSTDLVQQWGQFSQNLQSDLHNDFPGTAAPNGGTGAMSPDLFKIANDTGPAGAVYVGVPGAGYYWVPTPEILNSYVNAKKPIDLGTISQSDAQSRFGIQQPWSSIR